jgi:periplasmic divalent cation tolerance protein
MEKSTYVIVFITVETDEEAREISTSLLEQKKAACFNIIPEVKSFFWWEDRIDSARERLLVAKTKASMLPEFTELVKKIHSYTVPEIIALPIVGGNQEYLDWIEQSLT